VLGEVGTRIQGLKNESPGNNPSTFMFHKVRSTSMSIQYKSWIQFIDTVSQFNSVRSESHLYYWNLQCFKPSPSFARGGPPLTGQGHSPFPHAIPSKEGGYGKNWKRELMNKDKDMCIPVDESTKEPDEFDIWERDQSTISQMATNSIPLLAVIPFFSVKGRHR
jgi:hypothetical protein